MQALVDQHEQVSGVWEYLASMESGMTGAGKLACDVEHVAKPAAKPVARMRRDRKLPETPHVLLRNGATWSCKCCARRAFTVLGRRRMLGENCKRTLCMDRQLAVGRGDGCAHLGHLLWRTGAWTWCHLCGMHSLHKVRGLGRPCRKQVANRQAALHRDRLRDGLHPYSQRSLRAVAVPLRLCYFPV